MNFNNVTTLIKREYYELHSSVKWLAIFSTIVLFFVAISSLRINLLNETGSTGYAIKLIYSSLGIFIACFSFWEFRQPTETRHYLLIPATCAEKVLSKVAFYTIGWLLLFISAWIIASIIAVVIMVIRGTDLNIWYLLLGVFWVFKPLAIALPIIFCYQALSIFASLYFRKLVLLKLAIFYVLILLPLQGIITHQFLGILQILSEHNMNITFYESTSLLIFVELCITIALWFLTWLRLRETEAR